MLMQLLKCTEVDMKKRYESPEMEVIVLEQSDIITKSGPLNGIATTTGKNEGKWDNAWE